MVGGVFDLIRPLTISLTQCPEAIGQQGFWVRSLVGMKPAGLFRDPTSAESHWAGLSASTAGQVVWLLQA